MRALEERLAEAEGRAANLSERNDKLAGTLREAREQIVALKEEVDRLAQPPSGYGFFLDAYEDGTVDVFTGGRKLRVTVSPRRSRSTSCARGQEVMLNEAMNVVAALAFERDGDVVMLKEMLEGGERALVIGHTDEERVVRLAESLLDAAAARRRLAAARVPLRLRLRADPEVRGRGARPRRGPGHRLHRHRRAAATRSSRSATRSSCRTCTRTCSASTSCGRRRASCSTARPAAARR